MSKGCDFMNIDVSLVIALSATVIATLTPMATTCMNNRHERKMYELRFYKQHQAEAIENYIRDTGSVISSHLEENLTAYGKSVGEILLYVPQPLCEEISALHNLITSYDWSNTQDRYLKLCQDLAEYHPRRGK